ncbi:S16 family serine protease [Paenibacillus sp. NEAU-GSW1]|uniref:S16 family serine protease n=1 Tax=Paenibacillus sp. NEAU-GSW1 TaxID=2682486 RepID=UPI0012E21B6E|nr:S16 family serine protease [Paenibacillus sp. NEAU-GSW1]MUT66309.1 hypothetical protein [Paenibacillus sp. NEAU-GSW1]
MDIQRKQTAMRTIALAAATALFMWFILYAPSPFVIYEPGIAAPAKPMVLLNNKADSKADARSAAQDSGAFMITTVKLSEVNYWEALRASWRPNAESLAKRNVLRGYSNEQYLRRMSVIMTGSQHDAVEAAYRYAKIPYHSVAESVAITDSNEKSPESLLAGDIVLKLNNAEIYSMKDIEEALKPNRRGEQVTAEVQRSGKIVRLILPTNRDGSELKEEAVPGLPGEVRLSEIRSLQPRDGRMSLTVNAGEIGGPSAGLMFALQAVDLLTEGELSGGLKIAGTGTIEPSGKVGAIGGIRYKIVAADQAGAQLFIAPAENYKEAAAKAKAIGSSMRVISATTLSEAVAAIALQQPKA